MLRSLCFIRCTALVLYKTPVLGRQRIASNPQTRKCEELVAQWGRPTKTQLSSGISRQMLAR